MVKRSYAQFCPIARTMDVVGDRWTLLIVRELLTGAKRYTDLKAALGGMGSNLLAQRLRELEEAGIVRRADLPPPAARTVYELTARGLELEPVLAEIARFGLPYLDIPTEDEPMNPGHVPLALRALVRTEELPDTSLTISLELDEEAWTLRVAPAGPHGRRLAASDRLDVAAGLAEDANVTIRSSLAVLLWLRRGDLAWAGAIAQGLIDLGGSRANLEVTQRILGGGPAEHAA